MVINRLALSGLSFGYFKCCLLVCSGFARGLFGSSSGFLREFFGSSSGVLRENSLKYPRNPEELPKNLRIT